MLNSMTGNVIAVLVSQRFLPQGVSSKGEHKGFDILAPSRTPVLAAASFPYLHFEVHRLGEGADAVAVRFLDPQLFWVDGRGTITCYDKHREWVAEPLALSYPVPCLEMEWQ